jgi:rod shape-determining protein MreB and related proteins
MLTGLLANPIYVRVRKNQFRVRNLESAKEVTFDAQPSFTTARLLIGQFQVAENLLKRAVKEISKGGIFAVSPQVLIQPLEMLEGGLSEIEERALREVAIGAGASKVVVWVGHELSDAEVRVKLSGK